MPRAKPSKAATVRGRKLTATKCNNNLHLAQTKRREQAAQLVADDTLTDSQIAAKVEIDRATLFRWKQNPAFSARVQEIVAEYADRALNHGIARKEHRLRVLNDVHDRILNLVEERAADPAMKNVPGGKSGLVVLSDVKTVGKTTVTKYEFDAAIPREIRALHAQAADELGVKIGGAAEVVLPVQGSGGATNATQVNVSITQGESQTESQAAKNRRFVAVMRECYGLPAEYSTERLTVTKPALTSGSPTTGADQE